VRLAGTTALRATGHDYRIAPLAVVVKHHI
jgi:hypothetical protein